MGTAGLPVHVQGPDRLQHENRQRASELNLMEQDQDSYSTSVRLLIVDDSPSALRYLQAVFEHEQYDVLTANDGQEAYAKVNQFKPDLVITDSVMPMMGGFAL